MRVDVLREGRRVGSIWADGFEPSTAWVADLVVVQPGRPSERLTPVDGERYLKALPYAVRGTYTWGELVR